MSREKECCYSKVIKRKESWKTMEERRTHVYRMYSSDENAKLDEGLISGIGFDILLCILEGKNTPAKVADELKVPRLTVENYFIKLAEGRIIRKAEDGDSQRYELAERDILIMNNSDNCLDTNQRSRNTILLTHYFSLLLKKMMKTAILEKDKPRSMQAYFIRAEESSIVHFQNELASLYAKYKGFESEDAGETYGLFTVLAPFYLTED